MSEDTSATETRGREGEDWFWVLSTPITIHRDKMLVLELESQYEFVPVFPTREEAERVLARLSDEGYVVQAMHVNDIKDFALSKTLGVHTVNGEGHIVKVWELK
ncbi:MAG: hypothetical protein LBE27_08475 [Deltaproteobacteria bacterium]|jgi:hypothetical protein|nr:hypothetical protein [Deltaproteobacteria bacterium]